RGPASALGGNARAEVAAGDDHRNAPGDVGQAQLRQPVALLVGKEELLREVREQADRVDALVDHAVEYSPLTVVVDVAALGEGRWRDGQDAAKWWTRWRHRLTGSNDSVRLKNGITCSWKRTATSLVWVPG